MLQELTRELGQDLKRTVMIGDTTHDLQMAINAGAAGIGVQYGAHPAKRSRPYRRIRGGVAWPDLAAWLRENA